MTDGNSTHCVPSVNSMVALTVCTLNKQTKFNLTFYLGFILGFFGLFKMCHLLGAGGGKENNEARQGLDLDVLE